MVRFRSGIARDGVADAGKSCGTPTSRALWWGRLAVGADGGTLDDLMRTRATLQLDDGEVLRVELEREDLARDEIVVNRR